MAVIGARPATGPWFLPGRPRLPARTRPRARPRRRRTLGGRQVAGRIDVRGLLIAIAAAAGLALFYLSQSTHVAATGYQIEGLHARLAEAQSEQQQLVLQIGEARSPAEIARRAQADLRLAPLADAAVTFVSESPPPAD